MPELDRDGLAEDLVLLYDDPATVASLVDRLGALVASSGVPETPSLERDGAILITYADSVRDTDVPLRTLDRFLADLAEDGPPFSAVHVLPFFPASSDGGFAVVDHQAVRDDLGDWDDVGRLAERHGLMCDLVVNHTSASHRWFLDLLADRPPGRDRYVVADPDLDVADVVRPRTTPLLTRFETASGPRSVWTTFSADQPDLDLANPDVLVAQIDVLLTLLEHGASVVRLDAIAYAWKRIGTTCLDLPETHALVRVLAACARGARPDVRIVTETNLPAAQNVSYLAPGEADLAYNFTLAPLLVHAAVTHRVGPLVTWLAEQPLAEQSRMLNFIASHDGLGLRPVEDIFDDEALRPILDRTAAVGGTVSWYATRDGPRPYEINVALADMLDRRSLVLVHQLLCALAGTPAIWIHSLLASRGDHSRVRATGVARDVNRSVVPSSAARPLTGIVGALRLRRSLPALVTDADQRVEALDSHTVLVRRTASDGQVFVGVHRFATEPVSIPFERLGIGRSARDVFRGVDVGRSITQRFGATWLVDDP